MSEETSKILIADDHPLFKGALTYIVEASFTALGNQSIEIFHTADLESTLKTIEDQTIEWLFLDLNMPGSNGLSGLTTISARHPELSIVVISANESQDIIRSSLPRNFAG